MSSHPLKSFEEIQIGDSVSLVRKITVDDVRRFADLTGDDNPLHVDRAYAEATPFKGIVVHGMLGASLLSTLIGTRLPGEGALWVSQAFEFLHPIRLDDTLTVTCTVRGKRDRDQLLELEARIENQRKNVVLSGKGTVKVMARPAQEAEPAPTRPMVALVAGGAGGIGRAICRKLAADGFAVAVAYHTQATRAAEIVTEIETAGGRAIALESRTPKNRWKRQMPAPPSRQSHSRPSLPSYIRPDPAPALQRHRRWIWERQCGPGLSRHRDRP